MNGYTLNIPEGAPEFARQLAEHTIDDPAHTPSLEVSRIAKWLKDKTIQTVIDRARYGYTAKKALKLGYSGDIYWISKFVAMRWTSLAWLIGTAERFEKLLRRR